jgi:hypothetical protein
VKTRKQVKPKKKTSRRSESKKAEIPLKKKSFKKPVRVIDFFGVSSLMIAFSNLKIQS